MISLRTIATAAAVHLALWVALAPPPPVVLEVQPIKLEPASSGGIIIGPTAAAEVNPLEHDDAGRPLAAPPELSRCPDCGATGDEVDRDGRRVLFICPRCARMWTGEVQP